MRSISDHTIRIATPADYLDLVSAFGARTLPENPTGPWIQEGAQVDSTAVLANNVLVAEGAQVAPGAIIERSVLLKDVQVGSDALIARSIVRPSLQIPPRTRLIESEEVVLDARGGSRLRPSGRMSALAQNGESSRGAHP